MGYKQTTPGHIVAGVMNIEAVSPIEDYRVVPHTEIFLGSNQVFGFGDPREQWLRR
ncbi:hypothetical protein D3C76_1545920 [compost metagenome]